MVLLIARGASVRIRCPHSRFVHILDIVYVLGVFSVVRVSVRPPVSVLFKFRFTFEFRFSNSINRSLCLC